MEKTLQEIIGRDKVFFRDAEGNRCNNCGLQSLLLSFRPLGPPGTEDNKSIAL